MNVLHVRQKNKTRHCQDHVQPTQGKKKLTSQLAIGKGHGAAVNCFLSSLLLACSSNDALLTLSPLCNESRKSRTKVSPPTPTSPHSQTQTLAKTMKRI